MAGQKLFCFQVQGPKLTCFYIFKDVFLANKQAEKSKLRTLRARYKASAGHIWPAGRMLCMPALYSWASLYAIDRDQKIRLAYNEFAVKKTKNDRKLRDTFQKNCQFAIADTLICR